jgi:hypothetical protein
MLANQEDFDHKVKRVLQEVNSEEIPLDFLVDIEQRLDHLEKKKKRRVFMWFFMGMVLASAFTFGLLHENESSKTLTKIPTLSISDETIKPQLRRQLASSKGNKTIETMNVESAAVIKQSVVTRTLPSVSLEKRNITRFDRKNQSDVMQTALPVENIASLQTQKAIIETSQDAPVIFPEQKTAVTTLSDSVTVVSPIKNELMKVELSDSITIPEIVMNVALPKWTHSLGFYTGMSGVISSFQTDDKAWLAYVGAPNMLKYREIRSTQERSTSSIDISLRYRMAMKHLVLQTGVDFFEWGEQIQYDYSFAYDGINRYSYLSLPFYLGYRQAFQSFEWGANIGCSVGHVLQQKGRYIQPDLVTLALEDARAWSATGMAQLEFIYIFDRYRFSLAPTYRMSIGNVVNSTFTKNRYYSFGLQMGMAFQF